MNTQTKKSSQETVTNRILIAFTAAFFSVIAALYVQNNILIPSKYELLRSILFWVRNAALLAGVLAVGYRIFMLIKKEGKPMRAITPMGLAVFSFLVAIFCHIEYAYPQVVFRFVIFAIPAVTVLYIIFYIYCREFFYSALALFSSAIVFYLTYREQYLNATSFEKSTNGTLLLMIAMTFVVLLTVLIDLVLRKNDGKLKLGKRSFQLLPKDFAYPYVYLVLGFVLLGMVSCLLLGYTAAYVMMIASVVVAFLYAVYFTIKMI